MWVWVLQKYLVAFKILKNKLPLFLSSYPPTVLVDMENSAYVG